MPGVFQTAGEVNVTIMAIDRFLASVPQLLTREHTQTGGWKTLLNITAAVLSDIEPALRGAQSSWQRIFTRVRWLLWITAPFTVAPLRVRALLQRIAHAYVQRVSQLMRTALGDRLVRGSGVGKFTRWLLDGRDGRGGAVLVLLSTLSVFGWVGMRPRSDAERRLRSLLRSQRQLLTCLRLLTLSSDIMRTGKNVQLSASRQNLRVRSADLNSPLELSYERFQALMMNTPASTTLSFWYERDLRLWGYRHFLNVVYSSVGKTMTLLPSVPYDSPWFSLVTLTVAPFYALSPVNAKGSAYIYQAGSTRDNVTFLSNVWNWLGAIPGVRLVNRLKLPVAIHRCVTMIHPRLRINGRRVPPVKVRCLYYGDDTTLGAVAGTRCICSLTAAERGEDVDDDDVSIFDTDDAADIGDIGGIGGIGGVDGDGADSARSGCVLHIPGGGFLAGMDDLELVSNGVIKSFHHVFC
jgi:hypothetical protein